MESLRVLIHNFQQQFFFQEAYSRSYGPVRRAIARDYEEEPVDGVSVLDIELVDW
jgi:hypothetical protein